MWLGWRAASVYARLQIIFCFYIQIFIKMQVRHFLRRITNAFAAYNAMFDCFLYIYRFVSTEGVNSTLSARLLVFRVDLLFYWQSKYEFLDTHHTSEEEITQQTLLQHKTGL